MFLVTLRLDNFLFYTFSTKGPGVLLSQLKEGESAKVVRVGGKGPFRRRIMEMGIVQGTDIHVEKYAPLKDPLEILIKGYHVSLRVEEAALVTVERTTANG
jgi:Fe2+ transport system protein FeoA